MYKSFFIFAVLVGIGVVFTLWFRPPATATAKKISLPEQKETSVHSSRGDKQLILRWTPQSGGKTQYSYRVADISGANPRVLFEKTLPSGSVMSLPSNSWDPTDTYVFIEEQNGGVPNYFVMKSAGGSVIDVGAVWRQKQIPYTIRQATGWASGTLLIIYTSKDDGSRGPAYWFEIPSTAILQLAS